MRILSLNSTAYRLLINVSPPGQILVHYLAKTLQSHATTVLTQGGHSLNIHTALADYLTACAKLGKAPDDLSPWLPWSMGPDRKAFLSRPRPPDTS